MYPALQQCDSGCVRTDSDYCLKHNKNQQVKQYDLYTEMNKTHLITITPIYANRLFLNYILTCNLFLCKNC